MLFRSTKIKDVFLIEIEKKIDKRGFFSRLWCEKELSELNLTAKIAQVSIAYNLKAGTIRGLHYQIPPCEEVKIITCISGSVFDVVVDVRKNSETYGQYISLELNADTRSLIYIPKGCAHGYQTLEDNTTLLYLISEFYNPQYERGIRWNDSNLKIPWPLAVTEISEKDKLLKDFLAYSF